MAVEPQQQSAAAPNAAPAASTAPTGGGGAPQRVVESMSTRVDVISTHAGRILCVADVRGQSLQLIYSRPCLVSVDRHATRCDRRHVVVVAVVFRTRPVRHSALLCTRTEGGL